ncbi:C-GCAxxG-C-C family (seleno)protein [Clostridium felsineum]|uniref:C-GCAxxG-C-C family (seleno)protein n=1 Tax=Clostridium felsineum TaxID=36839 RepID=UPI00098C211A|nr:C-GCAxxG-C-C family (seleno)protein [Clostridium felsineum]URZ04579.1 hypothetical protein CLAUR_046680 [Clostridium felsineum]
MKKVVQFKRQGYNCAESIIKTIDEEKGMNIPVCMATPFGSGMSVGGTCGAITGALMVIGAAKGRKSGEEEIRTRKLSREIINQIKERYGTTQCIELKKKGVTCDEIIEFSYDILDKNI